MAARKISPREIMKDIKAGLSNTEIGVKYELSEKGTRRLFDKLLEVNLLTGEEHDRRIASMPPSTDPTGGNGNGAARKDVMGRPSETPLTRVQRGARFEPHHKGPTADDSRASTSVGAASQSTPEGSEIRGDSATESAEFIDVSKQGKNQWWRYLVGILFIVIFAPMMAGIARMVLGTYLNRTSVSLVGTSVLADYVQLNLDFVFLFVAIFLVVRLEHKRPFLSLITGDQSVDWKKMGKSFGIFVAILASVLPLDYLLDPEKFRFSLNVGRFLVFVPVVLLLTPIQTTAEELFFRGYLLQMLALLTKNRIVLACISGALFMLPHLVNPEVALGFVPMALYYCAVGGFLTLVTMKSNGLEVAMGMHAAMNLFVLLIANHASSALRAESIFSSSSPLNPVSSLIFFCIVAAVFYLLMFGTLSSIRRFVSRLHRSV